MPKKILLTPGAELAGLRTQLNHLASAVLIQLRSLQEATAEEAHDKLLAIVKNDKDIDALELQLDRVAKTYMELRAPMGPDFRYVLTTLDIARSLERIGDCIEYVARHVTEVLPESKATDQGRVLIAEMIDRCLGVVEVSTQSLQENNAELATKIPRMDDPVDALKKSAYDMVVAAIRGRELDAKVGLEYVLIAGKLESIADIACHIAECVVFIVSAKQVRHDMTWHRDAAHR